MRETTKHAFEGIFFLFWGADVVGLELLATRWGGDDDLSLWLDVAGAAMRAFGDLPSVVQSSEQEREGLILILNMLSRNWWTGFALFRTTLPRDVKACFALACLAAVAFPTREV